MKVKVGDELVCIKEDPWRWGLTLAPLEGFQAPKHGEIVKVVGIEGGDFVRLENYNPAQFRFSLYDRDGTPNFEKPVDITPLVENIIAEPQPEY